MPRFVAPEHRADGTIAWAPYEIAATTAGGWLVRRDGVPQLELGAGYRLLRASHCGICATDLARHRLPFPLPQVTGHEIVARDDDGRLVALEINASHAARALPRAAWCASCAAGRPTHCPDRLVLGIHGLPGGFAPWVLAPVGAIVPLPEALDPVLATLLEPFAAAAHAVDTIAPRGGDTIAVLGPGRLGSLVLAALAVHRARTGADLELIAIARSLRGAAAARVLGANHVITVDDAIARGRMADVVIDATGAPEGLAIALRLARREVHLKSTTGQPACGLVHATALVVDELRVVPLGAGAERDANEPGSAVVVCEDPDGRIAEALARRGVRFVEGQATATLAALPDGADLVVASSLEQIDSAIRPLPGVERALVRPRGAIALAPAPGPRAPLVGAILDDGLRLTTSRCGDLRAALDAFVSMAPHVGRSGLVEHVLPVERLAEGYAAARAPGARKVVMRHRR